MANRIKPLRRTGSTGLPNVANMQEGEIAVNSYDQKIWMRVGSNLVEIANAGGGTVTSVTGGNGLTGTVTSSGSITLGTPGTLSGSTTNSVTTSSHTHALSTNLSAWDGVTVASKTDASDFTYVGNKSGGTYDSHTGSGNNFAYLFHSAGGQPTDAPFSPTRQGAVLHMGNSWGRVQLAISNETTPQVFVRGATETTWTSVWTSGNFDPTAQPASNITSGTFAAARIPNLNASKITAGTFAAARIPNLSSSYVATSGNQTGLSGNKTWTGNHIFVGDMIARSSSASSQMTVERTGNTINSAVAYTTTGGTVYAGQGDNGYFNWGANTDLRWSNAGCWGRIGSGGLEVKGTVASSNALIRGGSSAAIFSFEGTTTGSTLYFRPRGTNTSTNQTVIDWNGNMSVGGTVSATNLTSTSDPRLKDDIKKVKARRELIEKLEYFSFKWKKDGVEGRSIMADKVQEIAPEHVHVGEEDGMLSVDKGALALEMVLALLDKLKEES